MVQRNVVFVTGAPGWLGSRLVEELIKLKRKVRCLVLKGSCTTYLQKLGAEIIEGNLTDASTIKEEHLHDVNTIFHCAGIIHPKLFRAKDFYAINREGTRNILRKSVQAGVKKFIYVSSNSAAGVNKNRYTLMTESTPDRPYTDYGKSKWQAEQIVKKFQRSEKIQTVIIRPCWFYGIRQPDRLTKLVRMIKVGNPFLFGDGNNLRSMTYIDDLVDALFLAEKKDIAIGKTYWIADERPYTTNEIYEAISRLLGVKLHPKRVPVIVSRMMEFADKIAGWFGIYEINIHVGGEMVRNIAVDISKAKRELGWKPKHGGLKEGMKTLIEWSNENNLII